jgi:hypothetical protein
MLRYASSFVVAAYAMVRLTPQDSRALPAELFYEAVEFEQLFDFLQVNQEMKLLLWISVLTHDRTNI